MSRFVGILGLTTICLLIAACSPPPWQKDPGIVAAKKACGKLSGAEQYNCYEREAVKHSNPEICRLVGMWIDDMCLQIVYETAEDPSICDRIYLQGVVPNCRAFYAQRTQTPGFSK